jgi:hypothetical protein
MLSAGRGDCLWIEYGRESAPKRILIDGGVQSTAEALRERISAVDGPCRFELLVVTHIDLDHIAGILELLRNPPSNLVIDDLWFNGWHHLRNQGVLGPDEEEVLPKPSGEEDIGILGAKQGEGLSYWIERRGYTWNGAFGGEAVVLEDGEAELPAFELEGGMRVTLLGPDQDRLKGLRKAWADELRKAGLKPGEAGAALERLGVEEAEEEDIGILGPPPDLAVLANGPFKEDTSKANGSSIALLLEHDGKRCLLTGDAYSKDMVSRVERLAAADGEDFLQVNALKLSHHGGKKNTGVELIRSLLCPSYLFSTDGSYYQHPDRESVARVILHGGRAGRPSLWFNHRTKQTEVWDDQGLLGRHEYDLVYPSPGEAGLRVDL